MKLSVLVSIFMVFLSTSELAFSQAKPKPPNCAQHVFDPLEEVLYANLESHRLCSRSSSDLLPVKGELSFVYALGVGAATHLDPRVAALSAIYQDPQNIDPHRFKSALDEWLAKHVGPYETVFEKDIIAFAESAAVRGELKKHPGGWVMDGNGYVDEQLYALLIYSGKLPITDPHHLFNHMVALLDVDYREAFKIQVSLIYEIARVGGFPSPTERARRGMSAEFLVYDQLQGFVRDLTVEDWSVIVHDPAGAPAIHGQGSRPMLAYLALRHGDVPGFAEYLLGGEWFESPYAQIESLPGISDFKQSPERHAIYDRFHTALAEQGADPDQRALNLSQLTALAPLGSEGKKFSNEAAADLFTKAAKLIQNDPYLAKMFSRPSRLELMQSANAFYRAYLDWNVTKDLAKLSNDRQKAAEYFNLRLQGLNWKMHPSEVASIRPGQVVSVKLFDAQGLITMDFDYRCEGSRLHLKQVEVYGDWIGNKLSHLALAHAFASCARITQIEADLRDTNATEYQRQRAKGANRENALRSTPMYKIEALFGFTEILNPDLETFIVGKPD